MKKLIILGILLSSIPMFAQTDDTTNNVEISYIDIELEKDYDIIKKTKYTAPILGIVSIGLGVGGGIVIGCNFKNSNINKTSKIVVSTFMMSSSAIFLACTITELIKMNKSVKNVKEKQKVKFSSNGIVINF